MHLLCGGTTSYGGRS